MQTKYNWVFTFKITELHIFAFVVILLHGILLTRTVNFDPYENLSKEEKEILARHKEEVEKKKKELLLDDKFNNLTSRKLYGINYLGNVEIRYKSKLSKLVELDIKSKNQNFNNDSNLYATSKNTTKNQSNSQQKIELTDKELNSYTLKLLKKNKIKYTQCYRKFQQLDELLEGHVNLRVKTGQTSITPSVKFQGIGRRDIVKKLENCIESRIRAIEFPAILAGKQYKLKIML